MNKINLTELGISRNMLEEYYVVENHNKKETAEHFNLSMHILSKLLKYFDLRKDMKLQVAARRKTCLERYGVDNPSKNPVVMEKIARTQMERYGAVRFTGSAEGKTAVRRTKKERYGDPSYNNVEKNRQTKLDRYGNAKYNNREKNRETCLQRYGVKHGGLLEKTARGAVDKIFQLKKYSELFRPLISDREASINFLQGASYSMSELVDLFNAKYWVIQTWVTRLDLGNYIRKSYEGRSHFEDEIVQYLKDIGVTNINTNSKVLGNGQEIDIFLPDQALGIEFNGEYWHSELYKDRFYHFNKSKSALDRGIHLIHIYEWEWRDERCRRELEDQIKKACDKVTLKLSAHDCSVNMYTLPPSSTGDVCSIECKLWWHGTAVQELHFASTDRQNWIIDLNRAAEDITVFGGTSKVLKYFIQKWMPTSIMVECDFNKYSGDLYVKAGLQPEGYTGPRLLNFLGAAENKVWGAGFVRFKWIAAKN